MELWNQILVQVNMKDIFDITVVSILIYQMLRIVHGTRALQMLIGMGFLMALFLTSLNFKLYSLNWLLSHFFDSFFIIAIVLFQDEVRSALASFGEGRKFWGFMNREEENLEIDEVVEACGALSREKVGGLLVIERDHGLMNYIETGTRLDAQIHSDLLYAIFQSRGPLHDGAIIISRGKIASSGCFLPLSKNELDRHLGTRHRAALGVSEVSDAIVIAVSEETGNIRICLDGAFYECKGERHLREYLKHLLSHKKLSDTLAMGKTEKIVGGDRG